MPESSPFLTVEYSFSKTELPPAEQQRLIALQAISDVKGLCMVLANLTSARIVEDIVGNLDEQTIGLKEVTSLDRRVEVFDTGIHVLGALGAAIGDTAYYAVEEMFTALTEAPKGKARSKGGAQ